MSQSAIQTRPVRSDAEAWRILVGALAVGLLIIGIVFHEEIQAAVAVWNTSTAYSHCFFVLPIALYLAWDRRFAISKVPVMPLLPAVLLVLPLAVAWLIAERLGIMEGRQLVMLAVVQVLFLTVLGWRMWWALCMPLLYLFFLVPFGAFVTPALQTFTARFVVIGLDVLGIPNYSDEFTIEIPEGNFYVAEACAGLRFLIASIAFGVLYACIIYRSPGRRALFIAASVVIPILANGVRALGIVTLGHIIGSAEAAATDHVLYGWMFFSIVILLLIAAGLPFRQDAHLPHQRGNLLPPVSSTATLRVIAAAAVLGVLAACGPALAAVLDRSVSVASAQVQPRLEMPAGCVPDGSSGAPQTLVIMEAPATRQVVTCGTAKLVVTVLTLPTRANPSWLAGAVRQLTGEAGAEDASAHPLAVVGFGPDDWRLTETNEPASMTATAVWLDGAPAQMGLRGRARQAVNSVLGSVAAPVVMAVGMTFDAPHLSTPARAQAQNLIGTFVASQKSLGAQVRAQSAVHPGS